MPVQTSQCNRQSACVYSACCPHNLTTSGSRMQHFFVSNMMSAELGPPCKQWQSIDVVEEQSE